MLKKKDQFIECLKKNSQQIFSYLKPDSLLNLSLCSKKCYLQVQPTLSAMSLDYAQEQNENKVNKKQGKKNKNKEKEQVNVESQKQVDINRVPLSKLKQNMKDGTWIKINKIPFRNAYLEGKLESGAIFFYQNTQTGKIIFINRSLVDPNLNYNRGGFNQDLQDEMKTSLYSQMFEGEINDLDFTSPEALKTRHRQMLEKIEKKKQESERLEIVNFEDQFVRGISLKKIAIILCFGGSFSFGIFEAGKCITHKSDKKYVCRKKAGQRQLNKDKQSGSQIYSMGSQIRRDQQKKHIANVGQILTENKQAIDSCDLVFLQAPGLNRLFIINDSETLSGVKDRLRSVCLTAKKANFTEVEAIYAQITKVSFVQLKQKQE